MLDLSAKKGTLRSILIRLAKMKNIDVCSYYQYDESNQSVSLLATQGLGQEAVGNSFPISTGITGRVIRTKEPIFKMNPETDEDFYDLPGSNEKRFKTYQGLPIFFRDQIVGVLVCQSLNGQYYSNETITYLTERIQSFITSVASLTKT